MAFKFRYKNILLYTTHQWCGNTLQYFIENTERLAVFLLMPRVQTTANVIRIYERGKLMREEQTPLSENFFLYYLLWYFHYIVAIFKYFPRSEKLVVITAHPYVLFATQIQKLFRRIVFVYWIADYWPPTKLSLLLFEKLKMFYHKHIDFGCYLGDGVNKIMNGKIVNSNNKRTIMFGVNPKNITRNFEQAKNTLLYVGVVRPYTGLEIVYEFLKKNKNYSLRVIGNCENAIYKLHKNLIRQLGLEDRVFFPNIFYFDDELNKISGKCFIGIALYDTSPDHSIYYADPGKIKAYTEMGLPIIMTNTSSIYPYIKKFHAGEVIKRNTEAFSQAVKKIKADYYSYKMGVEKFNQYFYYNRYYNEKFNFLEKYFKT